eukprot:GHVS01086202.1.p1 GENE.GHVS01086202.1~~GHVS01086202.1.p1  ORF type:complete len:286 (-),score=52.33 GHVS01086202.1:350-1207(-)
MVSPLPFLPIHSFPRSPSHLFTQHSLLLLAYLLPCPLAYLSLQHRGTATTCILPSPAFVHTRVEPAAADLFKPSLFQTRRLQTYNLQTYNLQTSSRAMEEDRPAITNNFLPGVDVAAPSEVATFGGGCFWGVEKLFRQELGSKLKSTSVGYMGGQLEQPTYSEVCQRDTGHAEVVQVEFFTSMVTYEELLHLFFRLHDPTTLNRQDNDLGPHYRSVIFASSPKQKGEALAAVAELQPQFSRPIVTQVVEGLRFWRAEDYHQLHLEKNPGGYCSHRLKTTDERQKL